MSAKKVVQADMRRLLRSRDYAAVRTAAIYAVISALWILTSDILIARLNNIEMIRLISIVKGWAFVAITAILLYSLIRRDLVARESAEAVRRQEALALERDKRQFYKETILAVTNGKFELCDPDEATCRTSAPEFSMEFSGPEDVAPTRHAAVQYCLDHGLSEDKSHEFELALGEALGNAVKHVGRGRLDAGSDEESLWIAVIDYGSGIDTFAIPRVALTAGYTTKASMGLGYTMILNFCDCVRLSTGPTGTSVVMEKRFATLPEEERQISKFTGIP